MAPKTRKSTKEAENATAVFSQQIFELSSNAYDNAAGDIFAELLAEIKNLEDENSTENYSSDILQKAVLKNCPKAIRNCSKTVNEDPVLTESDTESTAIMATSPDPETAQEGSDVTTTSEVLKHLPDVTLKQNIEIESSSPHLIAPKAEESRFFTSTPKANIFKKVEKFSRQEHNQKIREKIMNIKKEKMQEEKKVEKMEHFDVNSEEEKLTTPGRGPSKKCRVESEDKVIEKSISPSRPLPKKEAKPIRIDEISVKVAEKTLKKPAPAPVPKPPVELPETKVKKDRKYPAWADFRLIQKQILENPPTNVDEFFGPVEKPNLLEIFGEDYQKKKTTTRGSSAVWKK